MWAVIEAAGWIVPLFLGVAMYKLATKQMREYRQGRR